MELSEPDVWDRRERTCCVSVPMPQETTPWSDADATGSCLSVIADAQSLWSSLDDTSFRRSAASESSRPEGFISDMEAAEDAGNHAYALDRPRVVDVGNRDAVAQSRGHLRFALEDFAQVGVDWQAGYGVFGPG